MSRPSAISGRWRISLNVKRTICMASYSKTIRICGASSIRPIGLAGRGAKIMNTPPIITVSRRCAKTNFSPTKWSGIEEREEKEQAMLEKLGLVEKK